jgi:cysteine desulfurase
MDNPSSTRVDPRVLEAMLPYFTKHYGHAASRNHQFGWDAEKASEDARDKVARLIGATAKEIIFTSGGTEANNLAIRGVAAMYRDKGNHIITSAIESRSILDVCRRLEKEGCRITIVPVDPYGRISPDTIRDAIEDGTVLITLMLANNEIGTIQPVVEIGRIARERGVLFHVDATQAAGTIPIHAETMGIDLLSLTAHLLYGPKGIGALYARRRSPRVRLAPILDGGGHERGLRPGTLNVPGAVGLGAACDLARQEMATEAERVRALRDQLEKGILETVDQTRVNGHPEHRLPGITNISFAYVEGEALTMAMREFAVASGSACTAADLEPSHVLQALGLSDDLVHTAVRFGLGRFNTAEEVDYAIRRTRESVQRLREMSPLFGTAKKGVDISSILWPKE